MSSGQRRAEPPRGERGGSTESQLQVLLLDYEMAREDERVNFNTQATMLSVAVALLAGIAALVSSTCQFQGIDPHLARTEDCTPVPPFVLAATPLVPLALFAFITMAGATATIRSYYTRALERELQANAPTFPEYGLPASSLVTLTSQLTSFRRGRIAYRLLATLVLGCQVVLFGGFATYVVYLLDGGYAVAAGCFYGGCTAFIAREALSTSVGGRSLFQGLVARHMASRDPYSLPPLPDPIRTDRSMSGYLLLPRPQDLVKWLFVPATYGLGLLATGRPSGEGALRALVVFLVLEYLIYQARYQWNDIRGFYSDQSHEAAEDRRRLPGPVELAPQRFSVSFTVAGLRLVAALGVVLLLPGLHLGGTVLTLVLAVFGVAVLYEILRELESWSFALQDTARRRLVVRLLWLVVGTGYAIRGLTGLSLAVDLADHRPLTATTALTLAAFGVSFVAVTWSLEATVFAEVGADGKVRWPEEDLPGRQHVLDLHTWLPPRASSDDVVEKGLDHWRPLTERIRLSAPHAVATVVAGAAAGATGVLLFSPAAWWTAAVAALAGAVLAAATISSSAQKRLPAVAATAAVGGLVAEFAPGGPGWEAALPWSGVLLVYVVFTAQSWYALKNPFAPITPALGAIGDRVGRLVLGSSAWERLRS